MHDGGISPGIAGLESFILLNFNCSVHMDYEVLSGSLAIFNVVAVTFFLIGTPAIWAYVFAIIVLVYCCCVELK
jgi:hypothetical protein